MEIVMGIVIALIVAGVIVMGMQAKMKPVAPRIEASDYIGSGDVRIEVKDDLFLRTERSVRRIERK